MILKPLSKWPSPRPMRAEELPLVRRVAVHCWAAAKRRRPRQRPRHTVLANEVKQVFINDPVVGDLSGDEQDQVWKELERMLYMEDHK